MKQFSVGTWHIDDPTLAFGRAYPFSADAQAIGVSVTVRLVELHVVLENRFVIPGNPKGAVEVDVPFRPLQQTFVFEPFDVWKVAQRREPKHLQEFLRRDIGEGRTGLGRAQGPVDEIEALQAADDVAADLLAGESRHIGAGRRLQVSNRRHRQKFGRRQLGRASVAKIARTRRPDRVRKARFGAQLIAAGDEDEFVGSCAQLVRDVGDQIV